MKRFLALARVSSREQEREGFSLDVQEDALKKFAERQNGHIVKFFRIAETASKNDERQTFKILMAYAKENAQELDGLLFYKVDRAARNIFDYVELERLELEYGLRVIYVAQPTENSPAGRMQRRILSNMASFYTEQQSLDVKEGLQRRVKNGLFIGHAPYGFRNIRIDGRGFIEVHPDEGPRVKHVFDLYAYHNHTLDSLGQTLFETGQPYTPTVPRFPRSKLHHILRDRSYIGEIRHGDEWKPGSHQRLIDAATWHRVQVLLGDKIYKAHEMTYAGELIRCGHCGHPITGESKTKQTKHGPKEYVYYRCARYNTPGHPRIRITEDQLDTQFLALFDRFKLRDFETSHWFGSVLQAMCKHTHHETKSKREDLQRQVSGLVAQQERLLNMRVQDEIDATAFTTKNSEIKDRVSMLKLELDACDRGRDEYADLAVKAFELSQSLAEKWFSADYTAKRKILEIICLNCKLENTTLVPTIRKPFDILTDELVLKNGRGDRI